MALTITKIGSDIVTEKLTFQCVSDDPLVTSVLMTLRLETGIDNHTLEHLPDFGTNDTFTFEVNSILKDYFTFEFQDLTGGVNATTTIDNVIYKVIFNEVIGTVIQGVDYTSNGIAKNITQDAFEIEDFDITDYDCGTGGSSASKLLTSSPSPLLMGDLTSTFVSALSASYSGTPPTLTPLQEWAIEKYDAAGVLVNATFVDVEVAVRSIDGLSLIGAFDIATLKVDMDTSTGEYETRVHIRDKASPYTTRSETKIFKINDACERAITISWMNEFGTQDDFTFLGNINRVGKYTDSSFKRVRPVNPLSTNVGDLVYKSSYNYEYDIYSDRMPESVVQWLSKVLINKRAAIQTEASPSNIPLIGFLYNWFVIDQGNGGDGTASGGIVNQSQTGWKVPDATTDYILLKSFIVNDGGKLKQTGIDNWLTPNTGATNSTGFNALGVGARSQFGIFFNTKNTGYFMTHDDNPAGNYTWFTLLYNSTNFVATTNTHNAGSSIRLFRAAVGGENDGDFIPNAYQGNDGQYYDGVVIGTQVWINRNLYETKLNDGTTIPNVTDATAWSNLSTGAFCVYDNAAFQSGVDGKYFPILITTEETTLDDKFTPETLFRLKFRLANRRKGLK